MKLSASKIKCYKSCKRAYFFKYIEELVPVQDAEPLVAGKTYHSMIENLYKTGGVEVDVENNPKISAMAKAYEKYIYPKFSVVETEKEFEFNFSEDISLVGRFDGIAEDGCVVEHKTTSQDIDEEYIYNLQWDEQILTYMLASGKNEIYYTVCKKPTIRQKQNETPEEYYERCLMWYEDDTSKKINVLKVVRDACEVNDFKYSLIYLSSTMEHDERWGAKDEFLSNYIFFRNCSHCTAFGRKCEYASICLDYDPNFQYIEFKKKEN